MIWIWAKKYRRLRHFIWMFSFLLVTYFAVAYLLPLPVEFDQNLYRPATKIVDNNGNLLYEVLDPNKGKKTTIQGRSSPLSLVQATIAAEDKNFQYHEGVDYWATLRAIYQNISNQRIVSGGSTITQQLARNIRNTANASQRTWGNKLWETLIAIRLDHKYSKEEVMSLYLNTVYYGNLAYGAETAALDYFDKHVEDLDLAESALLAGLPQSPSNYNPFNNLKQAKTRQKYVLNQMVKLQMIGQEDADAAYARKLHFRRNHVQIKAPHFVHKVMNEVELLVGAEQLKHGGLQIKTTLDLNLQTKAETVVKKHLNQLAAQNVNNGALLAVDVKSGEVKAWVGSKDYFDQSIDGAVDMLNALRQPGSAIKPFTYLLAFEKGWTPATTIIDIPTQFRTSTGAYTPKNYDLEFHGLVRVRTALASSYNVPAVKTLDYVNTLDFISLLQRFGMQSINRGVDYYGLSLTLGGGEVKPIELAKAYLSLANYGEQRELYLIAEIRNADGQVIYQKPKLKPKNLLGPKGKQHSFQIIDILSDNNARLPGFGAGSALELDRPAAVKTGTTRSFHDNWTVGFTPQLLTLTWAGNANGDPMMGVSGVDGAAPIWQQFMTLAHKNKPVLNFEVPEQMVEIEICEKSGLLPTDLCFNRLFEWFVKGEEPTKTDDLFKNIKVNRDNTLVITDKCLAKNPNLEYQSLIFEIYPLEMQKWVRSQGIAQPPRENCEKLMGIKTDAADEEATILIFNPEEGDSFLIDPMIPGPNQQITFQVGVQDQVQSVQWLLNGLEIAEVKEYPFSVDWQLKPGQHLLTAKDSLGNISSVKFEVK